MKTDKIKGHVPPGPPAGSKLYVGYSVAEVSVYDFPLGTPGKKWNRKQAFFTLPRTDANVAWCHQIVTAKELLAAATKVVENSSHVSPMGDGSIKAIRAGGKFVDGIEALRVAISKATGGAQ